MENSMESPQNLKIELPYAPAIPFLGTNLKSDYNKDSCTHMFIAALFTIAKF
jgi:hypothetical protein